MRPFPSTKKIKNTCGDIIIIRPYEERYYSSLIQMYDSYSPLGSVQGLPPIEKETRHQWVEDMISRGSNVLAMHGDRVIGQASFFSMPVNWVEYFIFIHQDFQRKGIGTAMTVDVIKWARKENLSAIWLSVERNNYIAISLYRNVGFQRFQSSGFELEMLFTISKE